MTAPETLGFKEFADHLGYKPSYITALKKDGRLVLTDDGKRVRVAESIARIDATRNPARADVAERHAKARATVAPAKPAEQSADKIGNTYQAARAVKERYLAMSAKRDYEESMRSLLPADAVQSDIASAITTLRTRLEMLPEVLSPILAGEADETRIRNLIADEIERTLSDLAADFTALASPAP